MGLFNFAKKQLLSVLEWKDDSKDTIVYRHPVQEREEIMNSSTLVVRESQVAVFVHKGQIADVFGPGTYKLNTENIPFLTKMLSLPTGFNSRIKAEVYFVNTKQFIGQKWGTQNPVMLRDADFGSIRLRGYGIFSFKVEDAKVFMKEVFGTNEVYSVADVSTQCKSLLVQNISDAIGESKLSALDFASNYKEIADKIVEVSSNDFSAIGLKLCSVVVENLSLPDDVEKMLDERSKMGIIGDKMGTYTQFQSAQAIRDAAQNESGGNLAGLGLGLGAGAHVGNIFGGALASAKDEEPALKCTNCGTNLKKNAKFCPECGFPQVKSCPKCNSEVVADAKFCSNCGEKALDLKITYEDNSTLTETILSDYCPHCGADMRGEDDA